MSTDVRPPVEQMSELSWARVERGLWARLDGTPAATAAPARPRRWIWIAVPSVAIATAAAATFALLVDERAPGVTAGATNDDGPARIVSSAAPTTVTLGAAHVTLDPESAVVMPRGSATAVLERGAAWFAIAPRAGRQFEVVAGDTVVRVIGTRFRVARSGEHATVEVEHGLVEVTFRGTTTTVPAGAAWSSHAGDARSRYEQLAALEATDPQVALAGYLELARGADRWAEISLFAAARLAADRGDARAPHLLASYLRRFPGGANTDDARHLLDRLKGAP